MTDEAKALTDQQEQPARGTMKALHLTKPRVFVQVDADIPRLAANQALVRFRYAMICGSDIPKFRGDWREFPPPLDLGMPIHECVGVVEESTIQNLMPGAPVLAMPDGTRGLSEYFVSSADRLVPLYGWPEEDLACAVFGQPTGAAISGIEKLDDVRGKRVLIVGLGCLGLNCAQLLRQRGCQEISGIEPNAFRREFAATHLGVKVHDAYSDAMKEAFDISIEVVGHQHFPETAGICLDAAKPGGAVLLLGVPTVEYPTLWVRPIINNNLHVIGSIQPCWPEYLAKGLRAVRERMEEYRPMLTHAFPWQEAAAAFELFDAQDSERIKVLLRSV